MAWIEDQAQKSIFLSTLTITATAESLLWCWKKRLHLTTMLYPLLALGGLNNSRVVIHYITWKPVMILQMLMRRQLKNFWNLSASWLWWKITCPSKSAKSSSVEQIRAIRHSNWGRTIGYTAPFGSLVGCTT